jgi:endonuclease YncB( thermonuclease family)
LEVGNGTLEVLMRRIVMIMLIALCTAVAIPSSAHTLIVAEVHSGSVVESEGGFTVHLTGVRVPEWQTQIGWKAYDFIKRRLEGKRMAVFTWTTDDTAAGIVFGEDGLAFAKISYGRDLTIDMAAELPESGYAKVDPGHLPEGFDHYREIERRAQEQNLGVWANPTAPAYR